MEDRDRINKVPEGPQIAAETWFSLAVAASIIAICVFSIFAVFVFTGDAKDMASRSQAFTPFGAALIAMVTFCTIAWRGVLNTKQLEYQAAQIAHQAEQLAQARRQNDAKDHENIAKLLMDGAKLMGDEKPAYILAGVAALQAVVVSPQGTFSNQAMDILVDLIEDTYSDTAKKKIYDAARIAVNTGADIGRRSSRRLRFIFEEEDSVGHAIRGVSFIFYKNATISSDEIREFDKETIVRFDSCKIEDLTYEGENFYARKCAFIECKIQQLSYALLRNNTFENCDFSGAIYEGRYPAVGALERHPFYHLRDNGNYFNEEDPIRDRHIDWGKFMLQNDAAYPDNSENHY